jgi:hypothetical protein
MRVLSIATATSHVQQLVVSFFRVNSDVGNQRYRRVATMDWLVSTETFRSVVPTTVQWSRELHVDERLLG